jgi:hypothetical protein
VLRFAAKSALVKQYALALGNDRFAAALAGNFEVVKITRLNTRT